MFLQYILKEEGDTLLHSFLVAQMEDTLKGDWWETVQKNIVEIKLVFFLAEPCLTAPLPPNLGPVIAHIMVLEQIIFLAHLII